MVANIRASYPNNALSKVHLLNAVSNWGKCHTEPFAVQGSMGTLI